MYSRQVSSGKDFFVILKSLPVAGDENGVVPVKYTTVCAL